MRNQQETAREKGRFEQAVITRFCPECGALLVPDSGCFYCRLCGFSLCKA